MSLRQYIHGTTPLFITFATLLIIVNAIIYLGRNVLWYGDLLYLNILLITVFIIYFLYDYIQLRAYYKRLKHMLNQSTLPNSKDPTMTLLREQLILHRAKEEELIQKNQDLKDFLLGWIHEAKTPVSALKLMIDKELPHDTSGLFAAFEEERSKIENRIDQVLYYTRLDDFEKDYLLAETNLHPLIMSSIKSFKNNLISKGIQLDLQVDPISILTDSKWLFFILAQILSNSIKYSPNGSTLHIKTKEVDHGWHLIVRDEGVGIKSDELGRIYDRGYTGSLGRIPGEKSTGLGLYLAHALCKKLGHQLHIDSTPNEGTTVSIIFNRQKAYFEM